MGAAALAATAAVVLVAAVVQGASGIGFALVAVPLLSVLAVDAKEAVVLANALGLVTSGILAVRGRDLVDRPRAGRLLAGAVLGIPVGLLVILSVPDRVLQAVIGVAVLASVALLARGWHLRQAAPGADVAAGLASGALNTALGTGGPPVTLLLQARRLEPGAFRATVSAVFVAIDVVAVVLLAAGGLVTRDAAVAFATALPALGVGWWLGDRLHHRIPSERFRGLVLGLSAVTAVIALAGAVRG